MKYILIALIGFGLMGCVTTESSSGWSFRNGNSSNKNYNYNVVSKEEGYPVRSGETSFRFEVRSGDCGLHRDGYDDCKHDRERREQRQVGYDHGENWYHWSIYLSKDFPDVFGSPILGQWHYEKRGAYGGGPVAIFFKLALVRVPGTKYEYVEAYVVDPLFGGPRDKVISTLDDMRGKWTDVLVHTNWSRKGDGFFRVYVNGNTEPIFSYSGVTRLMDVYFKFGIYRGRSENTHIVYYDDVRKGNRCEDVTEYFDCAKLVME